MDIPKRTPERKNYATSTKMSAMQKQSYDKNTSAAQRAYDDNIRKSAVKKNGLVFVKEQIMDHQSKQFKDVYGVLRGYDRSGRFDIDLSKPISAEAFKKSKK